MEPITRIERILSGEQLEPISRLEAFFEKALGYNVNVPEPLSRIEHLLNGDEVNLSNCDRDELFVAKFMGKNVVTPTMLSRFEYFISNAQRHGTISKKYYFKTFKRSIIVYQLLCSIFETKNATSTIQSLDWSNAQMGNNSQMNAMKNMVFEVKNGGSDWKLYLTDANEHQVLIYSCDDEGFMKLNSDYFIQVDNPTEQETKILNLLNEVSE